MSRAQICDDRKAARKLLQEGVADVALVERDSGITYAYWLVDLGRGIDVPAAFKNLPGYRFVGIAGVPDPPMATAFCYRKAVEVLLALSPNEPA